MVSPQRNLALIVALVAYIRAIAYAPPGARQTAQTTFAGGYLVIEEAEKFLRYQDTVRQTLREKQKPGKQCKQ